MSWFKKTSNAEKNPQADIIETLKSGMLDKVSAAIMMVDRDFVVKYVNQPTRDLLSKHEADFKALWPTFSPDKIVGMCIDTFHKNPGHQRKMLADPSRLPFKTEITVGDLKIALSVNGCFDAKGEYVGNMLEWMDVTAIRCNEGMLASLNRAQAVIEFTTDGRIQHANENFLKATGYALQEIVGKHHSMFCDPEYANSQEYKSFWARLAAGKTETGQVRRFGKSGAEIWLQASYDPILDANGKAFKVVKYATDITDEKKIEVGIAGLIEAAAEGDFTRRVDVAGKTTSLAKVATGVNTMCSTVQHALDDLLQMLSALSKGDLTQRIEKDYRGVFAKLRDDANATASQLGATIAEIKSAAREVTNASAEISTSTTDLSQRTEEQAASLEQTSASMEHIAATVKKNAENATSANEQARGTREVANRGGEVVAKAVEAMARIEESSRKISDIIGVIDEIARQTNLLALNAAVEAARAGEAGRGFAVVASEVRSLAQRSSQAAKDIKDLITNSSSQVKDGVDLVNRAGGSLNEIVESIRKVADIVSEIASASAEQSTGIEEINRALTQMDEVTQQNSALVEENAATVKTLEHQAQAMDERVSYFVLDEAKREAAPRMQAAKPAMPTMKPPVAKRADAPRPAVSRPAASRPAANPVGRMQAALATAVKQDPDWEEF